MKKWYDEEYEFTIEVTGFLHRVDFIRTQVFPGNVDGMRFYERNGFCEMMKTIECQSLD